MELLYEGKAKQLFACEDPTQVYVHYKNSATAFNGEKKEEFSGKGALNNRISALIFRYLEKEGISTHFIEQVNETDQICQRVDIIPLEVIVRNRAAGSFSRRYGIEEGRIFAQPTVEFSYKKDELGDPLMVEDHILALALVTVEELREIRALALAINEALCRLFTAQQLILVDFKIEVGRTPDGQLVLADEISPDTCRLWEVGTLVKLDKDRFRQNLGSLLDGYQEVLRRLENVTTE
ncbi:phosphoribosylaminoimidazolesuccinocarboxamide synthase [Aerococcaceae bacterium NML191292]|nr:phosphoribosylaminoimidazolesuccinocarboxamide synthase [Aerococcaceae bacterium NML191292]MCW6662030.1 phosphoribosylaminoimidazolesuccinocarboxamide synthase [Aerococcaceae bacterium NML201209]MCW6662731.1 phosphoribosylaminoimidazolesuccinocarboxamide synthase [Aerococcaceae bacterium NML190073]MCW6679777.1 phosphoribosylaminoimidazolesuccinocarboxamide synthase [Aerococcaceae bacterium NML130460]MDO4775243.1 phosphoribosylaminoimidazolesuccinocarboxamide synthase [Aerococcaceae bacterium